MEFLSTIMFKIILDYINAYLSGIVQDSYFQANLSSHNICRRHRLLGNKCK